MKGIALAAIVSIFIAFLIPSIALASNNESGIISKPASMMGVSTTGTSSSSMDASTMGTSATDTVSGKGSNIQDYPSQAKASPALTYGECQNNWRGFWRGLSYSGPCEGLPNGAICLTYSDGYRWVVSDYRIDCYPILAGVSNCMPIELIRGYGADYYHILGTQFIMSIPRPEKITLLPLPLPCELA
jgi:hypothetical protein